MQFLVNALMLGGIYGLIAAGFSLVYGVMNILNVAHGAMVMLGAYIAYSCWSSFGWNVFVSLPIAFVALFIGGFLLHRYLLSFLSEATIFMVFIFTFGLQMVLQNAAVLIWKPVYRSVPSPFGGHVFNIAGTYVPLDRLLIFCVSWTIAGALFVLLAKTKVGLAIQATALDTDSARLAGVNVAYVYALTFGLSVALAGAAGALLAAVVPVYPFMDVSLIGKAFAVAVLGGLGSVHGAVAGGLFLAFSEEAVANFVGVQYTQVVAYAILVAVLIVRPRGFFGREHFAEVKI
jgi:branched-chain amino acid transport system permease protein